MHTLNNCRTFLFIGQDALSKLYKKLFNGRKLLKFSKYFLAINIKKFLMSSIENVLHLLKLLILYRLHYKI